MITRKAPPSRDDRSKQTGRRKVTINQSVLNEYLKSSDNPCPVGKQGPPGLQGPSGVDAAHSYIFDLRSIVQSSNGSNDFKLGDMNAPAVDMSSIIPLAQNSEISSVHMFPMNDVNGISLEGLSGVTLVAWTMSDIISIDMSNCDNVDLIGLNITGGLIFNECSNISVKSCHMNSLEIESSNNIDVRDCVIIDHTGIGGIISMNSSSDCTIQGNMVLAAETDLVINLASQKGTVIRDNLIVADHIGTVISSEDSEGIYFTHNTICSKSDVRACESQEHVDIYHNSFHNMYGKINNISDLREFNHARRFNTSQDYTGTTAIDGINSGTVITGIIRTTLQVVSDITLPGNGPSVIIVNAPCNITLPPYPPSGVIIDISGYAAFTITSVNDITLIGTGNVTSPVPVPMNTAVNLQYGGSQGYWIMVQKDKTGVSTIV